MKKIGSVNNFPTDLACEIDGSHIKPSSIVKPLGIIFDSYLLPGSY